MFKPSVPLCLAVTLVAICLSVTTDAMPNTATYARGLDTLQDAIVPEEELSLIDAADLSHFTGLVSTNEATSVKDSSQSSSDGHKESYIDLLTSESSASSTLTFSTDKVEAKVNQNLESYKQATTDTKATSWPSKTQLGACTKTLSGSVKHPLDFNGLADAIHSSDTKAILRQSLDFIGGVAAQIPIEPVMGFISLVCAIGGTFFFPESAPKAAAAPPPLTEQDIKDAVLDALGEFQVLTLEQQGIPILVSGLNAKSEVLRPYAAEQAPRGGICIFTNSTTSIDVNGQLIFDACTTLSFQYLTGVCGADTQNITHDMSEDAKMGNDAAILEVCCGHHAFCKWIPPMGSTNPVSPGQASHLFNLLTTLGMEEVCGTTEGSPSHVLDKLARASFGKDDSPFVQMKKSMKFEPTVPIVCNNCPTQFVCEISGNCSSTCPTCGEVQDEYSVCAPENGKKWSVDPTSGYEYIPKCQGLDACHRCGYSGTVNGDLQECKSAGYTTTLGYSTYTENQATIKKYWPKLKVAAEAWLLGYNALLMYGTVIFKTITVNSKNQAFLRQYTNCQYTGCPMQGVDIFSLFKDNFFSQCGMQQKVLFAKALSTLLAMDKTHRGKLNFLNQDDHTDPITPPPHHGGVDTFCFPYTTKPDQVTTCPWAMFGHYSGICKTYAADGQCAAELFPISYTDAGSNCQHSECNTQHRVAICQDTFTDLDQFIP